MSQVLLISTQSGVPALLRQRLEGYGYGIHQVGDIGDLVTIDLPAPPSLAIIEVHEQLSAAECVAFIQAVKGVFEDCKIIVTQIAGNRIDALECINAGAKAVYLLPFEFETFVNSIFELAPIEIPRKLLDIHAMAKVSIYELETLKGLPFETFVCLPANRKILTLRKKDSPPDESLLSRFKDNPNYSIFIRRSDLPDFQKFTAQVMSKTASNDNLTQQEKTNQLRKQVSTLVNGFFSTTEYSESEARATVETLNKVVGDYITTTSPNKDLYNRILGLASHSFSNFSHSINTSTFAGLFSIILGFDQIEQVCVAGLLHDIGMSALPPELTNLRAKDMTAEQLQIFRSHIDITMKMLSDRKMAIGPDLEAAIRQHHETGDGAGFLGLKEKDIHPAAKILALADEFDELISLREGSARLTPAQALMTLAGYEGVPRSPRFYPDFHGNLLIALLVENGELRKSDPEIDKKISIVAA